MSGFGSIKETRNALQWHYFSSRQKNAGVSSFQDIKNASKKSYGQFTRQTKYPHKSWKESFVLHFIALISEITFSDGLVHN